MEAVKEASTLFLSREQLITHYHRFRDCYTGVSQSRYLASVPLFNFTTDVQDEELDPVLRLTSFRPEDKTLFWNGSPVFDDFISLSAFSDAGAQLSGWYGPSGGVRLNPAARDSAARIITAMRLLKRGEVGAPAFFEAEDTSFSLRSGCAISLNEFWVRQHGAKYRLNRDDVPSLVKLIGRLERGKQQMLSVALHWFNKSYHDQPVEDRVIDLTIALESSLLSGLTDELKYRLALRGAALLADRREPRVTAILLKGLYDVRSKIVHEGQSLSDLRKPLEKLSRDLQPTPVPSNYVQEWEDIVRDVLRSYIEDFDATPDLKEINDGLDARIIAGLSFTTSSSG